MSDARTINTSSYIQGKQPTSFWRVVYVILHMKTDLSTSFWICSEYKLNLFLLIFYRRKTACTKCRCIRTIFHNKNELLICCNYRKHFETNHHNIRWNVFSQSVWRIKEKSKADSFVVSMLFCLQIWCTPGFLKTLKTTKLTVEFRKLIHTKWLDFANT